MGASVQYDNGQAVGYLAGFSTIGWVPNGQFHPLWDSLLVAARGVHNRFQTGFSFWVRRQIKIAAWRLLQPEA